MRALFKHIGLIYIAAILSLTGCRSSILHKDGMREAVTEPLIASLEKQTDKLHIDDLVKSAEKATDKLGSLIDEIKDTSKDSQETLKQVKTSLEDVSELVKKLGNTADNSSELVKTANELLKKANELLPELQKIATNTNEILPEIKEIVTDLKESIKEVKKTVTEVGSNLKTTTTESLWMKFLPVIVLALAILVAVFIIIRALKKGHTNAH